MVSFGIVGNILDMLSKKDRYLGRVSSFVVEVYSLDEKTKIATPVPQTIIPRRHSQNN